MGSRTEAAASSSRAFVLVHGAFHGGWCWRKVAARLVAAGHRVFTPTLTGLGERAHLASPEVGLGTWAQDIISVLTHEELSDVVLVGHSLGGATVSLVADKVPERIAQLIYLDAILVESGQSVFDAIPPEDRSRRRTNLDPGRDYLAAVPSIAEMAANVGMVDPDDIAWMGRHLTPQPLSAYTEKWQLGNVLGNGIPTTYVVCTRQDNPRLRLAVEIARRQRAWRVTELDACHNAMIEQPVATAALLISVARGIEQ